MIDKNIREMHDAIKDYLIQKHGIAFLNMSKHKQCSMITETFFQYLQSMKEERN